MKRLLFLSICLILALFFADPAQAQRSNDDPVTYEEIYDDPETLKKLFVAFQPIYGELWATSPSIGFGFEANYFLNNIADFRAHYRQSYSAMFEMQRFNAINNSTVQNTYRSMNHFEFGGTYHIKDFVGDGKTKMVLYKRNYEGAEWAATVPKTITIPSSVRKIIGARLGGIIFDATADYGRVLELQGLSFADLQNEQGEPFPETYTNDLDEVKGHRVFGNVATAGIYLGGSMTWYRNVAVDIDRYEPGLDDNMLTLYADLLIAPWINVEDVFLNDIAYNTDALATNLVGFRAGIEGRSNRTLGWSYGGELGYKPGLKKGGFFALLKIAIPVFATDLDYGVEAFGK